jgi:hypothetical protein
MSTDDLPGEVAFEIGVRLREYAKRVGFGIVRGDNVAFACRVR